MKNLICILVIISLSSLSALATNNPTTPPSSFTIEAIGFEMDQNLKDQYGIEVIYDMEDDQLTLRAGTDIDFIEIYKTTGELEYKLPIFSKEIIIDMNDFKIGAFDMNLMVNSDTITSSFLVK